MLKMFSSLPVAGYDKKYDEGEYEHHEGGENSNLHHQLSASMGMVVLIMVMLHHHHPHGAQVCMRVMVLIFCHALVALVMIVKEISVRGISTQIGASCYTKMLRTQMSMTPMMIIRKEDVAVSLHHIVKCSIFAQVAITDAADTIQSNCPCHIFTLSRITCVAWRQSL